MFYNHPYLSLNFKNFENHLFRIPFIGIIVIVIALYSYILIVPVRGLVTSTIVHSYKTL